MNQITTQFLENLWKNDPNFQTIHQRVKTLCKSLSPLEAVYIGRDLLIRRSQLRTAEFRQAAYLASAGIAGNDHFFDFTDCATLLPEDRFQKILTNHDNLIDDPISSEFDEYYLVSQITNIVDNALAGEDHWHILADLVIGDQPEEEDRTLTAVETQKLFPRIFEKFGHLMEPKKSPPRNSQLGSVGLSDFISDKNLRKRLNLDE